MPSSFLFTQQPCITLPGFIPAQLLLNQKVPNKLPPEIHRKNDEAKAKLKVHADTGFKVKHLGLMLVIWCWYTKENKMISPKF